MLALLLLADAGLIETTDVPSTVADITANPSNFTYAGAASLTGVLQLVTEPTTSSYYNTLVTRDELKSGPRVLKLYELLTSDETKAYINDFYAGLVIRILRRSCCDSHELSARNAQVVMDVPRMYYS